MIRYRPSRPMHLKPMVMFMRPSRSANTVSATAADATFPSPPFPAAPPQTPPNAAPHWPPHVPPCAAPIPQPQSSPQALQLRQPAASVPASRSDPSPFGPPPLLRGEDRAAYDEFLARVTATVVPADFIEEMWVRDIVDLGWEAFRLRRLKAQLMTAATHQGVEKLLARTLPLDVAGELARQWAAGKPDVIRQVRRHLGGTRRATETVTAYTLAARIDDVERITHMMMRTQAHRDAILRAVERRRAGFAHVLRRVSEIDDVAYQEVEAPTGVPE
jgi:hypothetical protein